MGVRGHLKMLAMRYLSCLWASKTPIYLYVLNNNESVWVLRPLNHKYWFLCFHTIFLSIIKNGLCNNFYINRNEVWHWLNDFAKESLWSHVLQSITIRDPYLQAQFPNLLTNIYLSNTFRKYLASVNLVDFGDKGRWSWSRESGT